MKYIKWVIIVVVVGGIFYLLYSGVKSGKFQLSPMEPEHQVEVPADKVKK